MTMDIGNMYLNTPLDRYEYMRIKLSDIPQQIIDQYKLNDIVAADGYVYMEIRRAMYGLKQSGMLANKELKKVLAKAGYFPSKHTPRLFTHKTRPISFTLVVDDFGVKYIGEEHAQYLLDTLNKDYKTSHDWDGTRYLGLTLEWDYIQRLAHVSMPGYCEKTGQRFNHPRPAKSQDQPFSTR